MKNEIRKEYLSIRKNILNKEEKSEIIFQKIIHHKKYQSASNIALYKNLKDEVSTQRLIDYSLVNGKNVFVPRVEENGLVFYQIFEGEKFVKSQFHVEEPIGEMKNLLQKELDLIIVPGVAFDSCYHRMGFGKGYYDRFLKDKRVYKIGICFHEQYTDIIPFDENDILMDEVIMD